MALSLNVVVRLNEVLYVQCKENSCTGQKLLAAIITFIIIISISLDTNFTYAYMWKG